MDYLDLAPMSTFNGEIILPGSKSLSNRILLLAALAQGTTDIHGLLVSDDTTHMLDALTILGVQHHTNAAKRCRVIGTNGHFPNRTATLFMGNAGTVIRPLTAVLACIPGTYELFGIPRMHERPIGDLVDTLISLGANIDYLGQPGYPPLLINPSDIHLPSVISVRGDVSSQFLTALLIALPLLSRPTTIKIIGKLISRPYIDITLNLMQRYGVKVINENWQYFHILGDTSYQSPGQIKVEGDASSASYFLTAGAIAGGCVTVHGIGTESIQGDARFAEILAQMGAKITWGNNQITASPPISGKLTAIDVDLNPIPDAAMTIAIAALFAQGTTTIRNIASWRVKETDRLSAMATELRKVGAMVEEGVDWIRITPPAKLIPTAIIDTYNDHRMAMCFSLIALGGVKVRINNPQCVEKTFPAYFKAFKNLAK